MRYGEQDAAAVATTAAAVDFVDDVDLFADADADADADDADADDADVADC